jgi:hypothetical protein
MYHLPIFAEPTPVPCPRAPLPAVSLPWLGGIAGAFIPRALGFEPAGGAAIVGAGRDTWTVAATLPSSGR